MPKPARRGHPAPVTMLCVPSVVTHLLNDPVFRKLVPEPPRRGRIGTTGEFVVVGVMDFLDAERGNLVNVEPVGEPDEDPAVVQMYAAKDLLPLVKDALTRGLVYKMTKQVIAGLPKGNTRRARNEHRRKHATSRAVRLRGLWKEVFGSSEAELERYALALEAPQEVRDAFRAGSLPLSHVIAVVNAGAVVAGAVASDIREGVAPGEAVDHRLEVTARVRSAKAAKGTFVRSVRRGVEELGGRVAEIKVLPDYDARVLVEGRRLIDELLTRRPGAN